MPLNQMLQRVCRDYEAAKEHRIKAHPLATYLRRDAAEEVRRALGTSNLDLLVEGSPGAGRWAAVPWIAIFDPLVTTSATRGYYPVYLFHVSQPTVHLSLNQGTTETRQQFGSKARNVLRDRPAFMRERLYDFADFFPMTAIDLGSEARLPGDYAAAHILGRSYNASQLPSEDALRLDLQTIAHAYRALTFRGGVNPHADEDDQDAGVTLFERRQYGQHRRIERNSSTSRRVKRHHGTKCRACGLDFTERYGPIGAGYIEAHHLKPISSLTEGQAVMYNIATDFTVLCSNCHRMIHRTENPADLSAFCELVRNRLGNR